MSAARRELGLRRACRIACLVVAASACGHSEASSARGPEHPPAAAARAVPAHDAVTRAEHMQASFFLAVTARDALIDGDLERAKTAARTLAAHDFADTLPPDWKHWTAQLQQHAEEVAMAPDFAVAAQGVAKLGLACGDCHAHLSQGPEFESEQSLAWQDPPEELDERMFRHAVGVDQMWLGLVLPSETDWRNGSITLTRAPLSPVLSHGEPVNPEFAPKLEHVRELAKRTRTARSYAERAEVYGELLSECASCHFVAGVAHK